jgi:hypothetical protein
VSIRSDFREGQELGIPLCCRLRFALEWAFFPEWPQAFNRRVCFTAERVEYVPCGILHQAALTHREREDLLMWLTPQERESIPAR